MRGVSRRWSKNGRRYFELQLSDRTGVINAIVGDATAASSDLLKAGTFLSIAGRVELFQSGLRIKIHRLLPVDEALIEPRDFIVSSYRDPREMEGFIDYFMSEVYDRDYSLLLSSIFGNKNFFRSFMLAPGDIKSHHAYLGGLAEHTISVATLCQHACVQHQRLNTDLVLTAALLHDIGKIKEFTIRGHIKKSREGVLLGHVLLGQRMIEEGLSGLSFPKEKEVSLLHAVVSHHGELEWGAAKRPQSAEALLLHHVDNLDAKVKGFLEVVDGKGEISWSKMQNYFRRPLDEPMAADKG